MASRIDTVKAQQALKARHSPCWQRIRRGCYLGLRKIAPGSSGVWLARRRDDETDKQVVHSLGHLDDVAGADRFDAAKMLAEEWFAHRGAGGSAKPRTIMDVCIEYVGRLRDAGREQAAADARGRFKRWVYQDAKLAHTALLKLTPKAIDDWRRRVAQSAARRVSAQAADSATVRRSGSALSRDMTALRAALNLALGNGHATSGHAWRAKLRPVKDADPPQATADFLAARCQGRRPEEPLLPRANGAAWNKDAWKKPLKVVARAAGLPEGTVAYALRHSAITDLIALHKLDTVTVGQLAGTSLLMIEKNYGHLLREHARSALAGLVL